MGLQSCPSQSLLPSSAQHSSTPVLPSKASLSSHCPSSLTAPQGPLPLFPLPLLSFSFYAPPQPLLLLHPSPYHPHPAHFPQPSPEPIPPPQPLSPRSPSPTAPPSPLLPASSPADPPGARRETPATGAELHAGAERSASPRPPPHCSLRAKLPRQRRGPEREPGEDPARPPSLPPSARHLGDLGEPRSGLSRIPRPAPGRTAAAEDSLAHRLGSTHARWTRRSLPATRARRESPDAWRFRPSPRPAPRRRSAHSAAPQPRRVVRATRAGRSESAGNSRSTRPLPRTAAKPGTPCRRARAGSGFRGAEREGAFLWKGTDVIANIYFRGLTRSSHSRPECDHSSLGGRAPRGRQAGLAPRNSSAPVLFLPWSHNCLRPRGKPHSSAWTSFPGLITIGPSFPYPRPQRPQHSHAGSSLAKSFEICPPQAPSC